MKTLITGSSGYIGTKLKDRMVVNNLDILEGKDIRNSDNVKEALSGCDYVVHLACLSNDPTADLDPKLTRSINLDSFLPLVKAAKDAGIKRFIFASSSSVYGVKKDINVTEDLPLEPLTDYSRYKAECEEILLKEREPGFEVVIVRPATVCGYSPAMRLDLLVNIFVHHAWRYKQLSVHGGHQYRPNIHIDDIVDAYLMLLTAPEQLVDGQIFNCGFQNLTILETAEMVAKKIGGTSIKIEASKDPRSYHVNSDKITRLLDFKPKRTIETAIDDMIYAFNNGLIPNPDDDKYYRIRQMNKLLLSA